MYYLYNEDYPIGNGTEWYHVTSRDNGVTWKQEGVAIHKYENGLGDIQTGSVVVDTKNTAGFGAGAVIALVTQQHDGIQQQSLFYSTDAGYTFKPYSGNPVMPNPGATHFRDPKILWDGKQWVMALAEGDKIGFYTSPNLKEWRYSSGFFNDTLGLLECPDLYPMYVNGDKTRATWVLGVGANGYLQNRTTGYAYWTGEWTGSEFKTPSSQPKWLDAGADFYAAVTYASTGATDAKPTATRLAMGWINNWAYAMTLPAPAAFGHAQTTPRSIALIDDPVGGVKLAATPSSTVVGGQFKRTSTQKNVALRTGEAKVLSSSLTPQVVRFTLSKAALGDGNVAFTVGTPGAGVATVTVAGKAQIISVDRSRDRGAGQLPAEYKAVRSTPLSWTAAGTVTITALVDGSALEIFQSGGGEALTSVILPDPQGRITLTSSKALSLSLLENYKP
jgi:levanbiose-producing levanase